MIAAATSGRAKSRPGVGAPADGGGDESEEAGEDGGVNEEQLGRSRVGGRGGADDEGHEQECGDRGIGGVNVQSQAPDEAGHFGSAGWGDGNAGGL